MLSLSKPHQYYQNLLSQGFGMGISMGLMFLPAISVPAHYFRARRSFAMGLVISGIVSCLFHPFPSNFGLLQDPLSVQSYIRYCSITYSSDLRDSNGVSGNCHRWSNEWFQTSILRAAGILDVCLLLTANMLMKARLPPRKNEPRPGYIKIFTDFAFVLYCFG